MTDPTLSAERRAAVRLLVEQERGHGGGLDAQLARAAMDMRPEDSRRLRALVYGIQRQRVRLLRRLEPRLKRGWTKTDPRAKAALLLGAFELTASDAVPDRAAVHQAVEACRAVGGGRLAGLVNAVLRGVASDPEPLAPDRDLEPLAWAVAACSMPRWIMRRLGRQLGPVAAAAWAEASNAEPPIFVRLRDEAPEGLSLQPTDVPGAWLVEPRPGGPVHEWPGFEAGAFWVADAAAQAVVELLAPQPGETLLDACAAPGGKTLALACAVGESGFVAAADRSGSRLTKLKDSISRIRPSGPVQTVEVDLLNDPPAGPYDGVLVDAPCSALGVLRRHPEIRWERTSSDLPERAAIQLGLLRSVAGSVRPGGRLVYSVCTWTTEETDDVVAAFLASDEGADFALAPPPPSSLDGLLDGAVLRTHPHTSGFDSFFAVRLQRAEG